VELDLKLGHGTSDWISRPKSENANWEDTGNENGVFDYDAKPTQFYFNVETVGGLEPDTIVQQGIKVLQQKLAAVISELSGGEGRGDLDDGYGPRSPDDGGYGDPGFTTPYANGGAASAWGGGTTPYGGGQTPYGATPYGNSGW
jgi:DNA-directed RNA polymerase II subunit RPB3